MQMGDSSSFKICCPIALVTGANKGIGLEISRQLARAGVTTILTSRDESRGKAALRSLCQEGLDLHFHQLDVTASSSITSLVKWIEEKFGRLDILINNAGVLGEVVPGDEVASAKKILETNFYGVKRVTEALLPFMNPGARIINISSGAGNLQWLPDENWRNILSVANEDNLSMRTVESFVEEFIADVKNNKNSKKWPQIPFWVRITDYSVSKMALNAFTRILARELLDKNMGINVCCVCPGYTKTGMTQFEGDHGPEVAAETAVWLAIEPQAPVSGKFYRDKMIISYEKFNQLEQQYLKKLCA